MIPSVKIEGDLICAAEFATKYNVNFMATYAKGLHLYADERCYVRKAQDCLRWWEDNTDNHATAFTVSIDHG